MFGNGNHLVLSGNIYESDGGGRLLRIEVFRTVTDLALSVPPLPRIRLSTKRPELSNSTSTQWRAHVKFFMYGAETGYIIFLQEVLLSIVEDSALTDSFRMTKNGKPCEIGSRS